jgi:hypothetical protein
MLSEYLVHLFKNPSCITQSESDLFNQLAKRKQSLKISGREPGWGLYFEEGWHVRKIIILYSLVILFGSFLFGIIWAVLKKDIQSAFTIVGCWITAGTTSLALLTMASSSS